MKPGRTILVTAVLAAALAARGGEEPPSRHLVSDFETGSLALVQECNLGKPTLEPHDGGAFWNPR